MIGRIELQAARNSRPYYDVSHRQSKKLEENCLDQRMEEVTQDEYSTPVFRQMRGPTTTKWSPTSIGRTWIGSGWDVRTKSTS